MLDMCEDISLNACRICLVNKGSLSIFKKCNEYFISDMIKKIANVIISKDDGLLTEICISCLNKIDKSYKLKLQCEESDKKMRDYFAAISIPEFIISDSEIDEHFGTTFYTNIEIKEEVLESSLNSNTKIKEEVESLYSNTDETDDSFIGSPISSESYDNFIDCNNIDTITNTTNNQDLNIEFIENDQADPEESNDIKLTNKKFTSEKTDISSKEKNNLNIVTRKVKNPTINPTLKIYDRNSMTENSIYAKLNNKNVILKKFNTIVEPIIHPKSKVAREIKTEFKCDICSKIFSRQKKLLLHKRRHGKKELICEICSMQFYLKMELDRHMSIHQDQRERPHKCQYCDKTFYRRQTLHIHIRRHTGEKPYVCKICSEAFFCGSGLNVHMKYHTGDKRHLCNICNKSFCRPNKLKRHLMIHTGEKPFVCEICKKEYSRSFDFKKHQLTHTGQSSQIKCTFCKRGFTTDVWLQKHIKKHHS